MESRFQFSLKTFFILTAATLAGGQTALWNARSTAWLKGGVPVALSSCGEVIFFMIGSAAALAGAFALVKGPSLLRIELPWQIRNAFIRSALLLLSALIMGSISAGIALVILGAVFFTMPHELFDLLTTNYYPGMKVDRNSVTDAYRTEGWRK